MSRHALEREAKGLKEAIPRKLACKDVLDLQGMC
jgi:hypothetical protein